MKEVGHLLAGKLLPFGRISTSFGSCMSESHPCPLHQGMPVPSSWRILSYESIQACVCLSQPGLALLGLPVMPTVGGSLTHTSLPGGMGTHPRLVSAAPSTPVPAQPQPPPPGPPPPGLAVVPQPHHLLPQGLLPGQAGRPELRQEDPGWSGQWSGWDPAGLRGGGGGGAAGTRRKAPPAQCPSASGWCSRAQLCSAEGPGVGLGPTLQDALVSRAPSAEPQ